MITHSDDGPEFDPDDPLTVILRPPAEYLGTPPGSYERIRRGASRRRLLRAAAGAGVTCAVAVLVALPFRMTASGGPATPSVPLAPPPATSPPSTAAPTPSPSPSPSASASPSPRTRTPSAVPTRAPAMTPAVPTTEPSAARTGR